MINRLVDDAATALRDISDGATILIGGFGGAGSPTHLIDALLELGTKDLYVVVNNAGTGTTGLAALLAEGRVRKLCCSYPRAADSQVFDALYRAGKIELELVPQGNLAERLRAAGAGLGGFFTRTGFGTELAKGKETREINGQGYVFEEPIHGDFALVWADTADRWGNLTYDKTARNFNPVMATAAATTVAEVARTVALGEIDPEHIITPGIYVDRVVVRPSGESS